MARSVRQETATNYWSNSAWNTHDSLKSALPITVWLCYDECLTIYLYFIEALWSRHRNNANTEKVLLSNQSIIKAREFRHVACLYILFHTFPYCYLLQAMLNWFIVDVVRQVFDVGSGGIRRNRIPQGRQRRHLAARRYALQHVISCFLSNFCHN